MLEAPLRSSTRGRTWAHPVVPEGEATDAQGLKEWAVAPDTRRLACAGFGAGPGQSEAQVHCSLGGGEDLQPGQCDVQLYCDMCCGSCVWQVWGRKHFGSVVKKGLELSLRSMELI